MPRHHRFPGEDLVGDPRDDSGSDRPRSGLLKFTGPVSRIPRASLSIALLGDEDFRLLIGMKGGAEAFGVFVAMLVVGRERLQQGQARQLSEHANSESLRFDNSTTHVLALAYMKGSHLSRAIAMLAEVAKITGSEPWMYLDRTEHLVIRSFFRFNVSADWGGKRPGAGRPQKEPTEEVKCNQDNQDGNHLEAPLSLSLSLSLPPSSCEPTEQQTARRPMDPGNPPVGIDGPGKESEAAKELEVWANTLGLSPEQEPYGFWARQTCDYAPAEWIRAILTKYALGRSGNQRKPITYLHATIGNWLRAGSCPCLIEAGTPDAAPSPGRPPVKPPVPLGPAYAPDVSPCSPEHLAKQRKWMADEVLRRAAKTG